MPRSRRSSPVLAICAAVALLVPSYTVNIAPVGAHCPGGANGYRYSTMRTTITSNEGIEGRIQWTNPSLCLPSSGVTFSASWVTDCDYQCRLGTDGWIQTGWIKRQGYSQPRQFCELAASQGGTGFGGPIYLLEFGSPGTTQTYSGFRTYTPPYDTWECMIEGINKAQKLTSWMGFAYADRLIVGGETFAPHSQIGKNYPSKLLFSDLAYINFGTYSVLNMATISNLDAPYGQDEPAAGQLRIWTNPH